MTFNLSNKFAHASLLLCLAFAASNSVVAVPSATDPSTLSSLAASSVPSLKAFRAPQKARLLQDEEEDEEPSTEEVDEEGEDSSEESEDDVVGKPTKRECDTEYDGTEVEFECKTKTDDGETEIKDKIKFKVEAKKSEVLKVKVGYKSEIETDATETEAETEYTVVFDRMIEYRKTSETSGTENYEWGDDDEVVAVWDLTQWKPLTPVSTDGNRLTFGASTEDDIAEFTFTITQSDIGDASANKMKIDFKLTDYPWSASDSYIALICHIETEQEVEIENEDGEDTKTKDVLISFADVVDTVGFTPFGEYTWANTAEVQTVVDENVTAVSRQADVDGGLPLPQQVQVTTISVIASTSPEVMDEGSEIAFSFVGAGQGAPSIYWDPEAGVGYSGAISVASSVLAGIGLAFGMSFMMF